MYFMMLQKACCLKKLSWMCRDCSHIAINFRCLFLLHEQYQLDCWRCLSLCSEESAWSSIATVGPDVLRLLCIPTFADCIPTSGSLPACLFKIHFNINPLICVVFEVISVFQVSERSFVCPPKCHHFYRDRKLLVVPIFGKFATT